MVVLDIAVAVPDQDLTRIFVRVSGEMRAGPSSARGDGRPLSVDGQALAFASVSTLVEVLRGLGGEASTANVELEVRCVLDL